MPDFTRTQEQALEAAREAWRRGGSKADGVAAGKQILEATTPAGYFQHVPGLSRPTMAAAYVPITTRAEADRLVNYLAEHGNYPIMSPCEAAGINGDAADGCPFAGEDFCDCDEEN
jgi:hypothetical protein